MLTAGDILRPVAPVEGGAPFPASWPASARSRLLAAMAVGVAERGFASTSVDDVLELARASRRTFYVHFENREHCLAIAHDAIGRNLLSALEASRPDLEHALESIFRYFAAWPAHAHVVTTEIVALGPVGIDRHEKLVADVAGHLCACTGVACQPSGKLTDEDVAQARVAAVFRLVQHRVNTRRAETLPSLATDLAHLMRGTARA